jgi:hypothetical protein
MGQPMPILKNQIQKATEELLSRPADALKKLKLGEMSDFIGRLFQKAEKISEKLDEKLNPAQNELIANTLRELLICQMRFLAGIYLSIFLQKDYKDKEMDYRVYNYFKGINNSYNELLGLCEEISRFLKADNLDQLFDRSLFKIRFDGIRLKTPPLSDNKGINASRQYIKDGHHTMAVMEALRSATGFLKTGLIEIKWGPKYCDNQSAFKRAAAELVQKYQLKRNLTRGLIEESGRCVLNLEYGKPIPLDPVIIPMFSKSRGTRLAFLVKFGGLISDNYCPIVYRELSGDATDFNTTDIGLLKRLYPMKGLVSEDPAFSYQCYMGEQDTLLQLYKGDIFDLNFLEGVNGKKVSAMVNVLYADLRNKTRLFQSLENLADKEILSELYGKVESQGLLRKDRVYTTGSGELNFTHIFHCPVYDGNENKNSDFEIIKSAIKNILKECMKKKIEWLIVPAMGSFYAGHMRQQVASAWCQEIQNMSVIKNSPLKRIIFSFINEETCEEYRKQINQTNGEHFATCHLPVSRLHNYLVTSGNTQERLAFAFDLSDYLYGFIVAKSMRALMWEKVHLERKGNDFTPNDEAKKFIAEIRKRVGIDGPKRNGKKWVKSMNIGDWRALAFLGYNAIKNNPWSFDRWYTQTNGKGLKAFKEFLRGGSIDFPKLRNSIAHSEWHNVCEPDLALQANNAVQDIQRVIKNMPFLEQDQCKMVIIDNFSVNEDDGMCTLKYRDLRGGKSVPRPITKNFSFDHLDGRLIEIGKVYLILKDPDESRKALNMHPFLLYGTCPGCGKDKLFVWRDFQLDDEDKVRIKYGSATCHCKTINEDKIAGFTHQQLEERFISIVDMLCSDKLCAGPSDGL